MTIWNDDMEYMDTETQDKTLYPTHRTSNYGWAIALALGAAFALIMLLGNAFAADDVKPACPTMTLAQIETSMDKGGHDYKVSNDPAKVAAATAEVTAEYGHTKPDAIAAIQGADTVIAAVFGTRRVFMFYKAACGIGLGGGLVLAFTVETGEHRGA